MRRNVGLRALFGAGLLSGLAALFLILLPGSAGAAVDPGDIPPDRLPPAGWVDTKWQNPGGFYTVDVTTRGLPPNNSGVDASQKVREIIASTTGHRVLYFPPGTYYFKTSLNITTDHIILRGAGLSSTRLLIDAPGSSNAEIKFSGAWVGNPYNVSAEAPSGSQSITVPGSSNLQAGDFIQIFKSAGKWGYGYPLESQIVRISSRSGDTLNLDMKLGLNYWMSTAPQVRKIDMLWNAGVDDLKIERLNQPTLENVNNLTFDKVTNGFIEDIESIKSGRAHINVYWSKNITIDRNHVHGAFVQNQGGYSYGISVNWGSTRVRVTDNKLWDLRHHILLQLGTNHSVVSYNSTESPFNGYNDIALHATFANMNLFEGNRFYEGYADDSKAGQGDLEPTGPGNTWFRNYANNQIGSINDLTARQNVIGNKLGLIRLSGTDHYHAASMENGTVKWGSLSPTSNIPASLYLSTKPAFLGSTPWPVFGPGVTDWGGANKVPAQLRPKP